MSVFLDLAGALVVALVAGFGWVLVSLRRLPTDRRPRVVVFSRSGRTRPPREIRPPGNGSE